MIILEFRRRGMAPREHSRRVHELSRSRLPALDVRQDFEVEIGSMPGCLRHSLPHMLKEIEEAWKFGVRTFVVFPKVSFPPSDGRFGTKFIPRRRSSASAAGMSCVFLCIILFSPTMRVLCEAACWGSISSPTSGKDSLVVFQLGHANSFYRTLSFGF